MEIIVCALKYEMEPLQKQFGDSVKFVNCGVYAKNLNFLKGLGSNDHITNIGVCAGTNVEEIYLCNKIIGAKTYYPDNFIPNNFEQKAIKTVDYLVNPKEISENHVLLYDQEAAIIFAEAQKFISPHQISFLKIVSDAGVENFDEVRKLVPKLIEAKIPEITDYISSSCKFFSEVKVPEKVKDLEKYSKQLKCTETMKHRLASQLRYAQNCNINVSKFFENQNPISNKKESLKIIEEFNDYLIRRTNLV